MQKVITVTTHTNIIDEENQFTEKEYPALNEYLEAGYKILQVVPAIPSSTGSHMYSLTFVLEK